MDLRIKLRNDPSAITAEEARVIAKALTQAFREGGAAFKQRGRAAIRAGGLSLRFASGLSARVYPQNGNSMSPRIFGYHHIPWAGQFENPEPISGKLWLPLSNVPVVSGGRRLRPQEFIKTIGRLYPMSGGKFLGALIRATDARAAKAVSLRQLVRGFNPGGRGQVRLVPLYVRVNSVSDPKRFDLGPVGESVARDIGNNFTKALANG